MKWQSLYSVSVFVSMTSFKIFNLSTVTNGGSRRQIQKLGSQGLRIHTDSNVFQQVSCTQIMWSLKSKGE